MCVYASTRECVFVSGLVEALPPPLGGSGGAVGASGPVPAHGDRCGVSFACDGAVAAVARTPALPQMTSYRLA